MQLQRTFCYDMIKTLIDEHTIVRIKMVLKFIDKCVVGSLFFVL